MKRNGEGGVNESSDGPHPYWSPYVAGVGLGVALLLSFVVLGAGMGASGGIARVAAVCQYLLAPRHTAGSEYFGGWLRAGGRAALGYYLVYMAGGMALGALLSALGSGRVRPGVERGPRISAPSRLALALAGGVLVGFASRLARGCTSGQALTGTALLMTGSAVFMVCLFLGAYLAAWFVRRQWR